MQSLSEMWSREEVVVIDKDGIKSDKSLCLKPEEQARCVFEYIYFARPDSKIDGMGVYESRINAGRILAKTHPVDADLVVGVPESGNPAHLDFHLNRYSLRKCIYKK